MAAATLKVIAEFFGFANLTQFRNEWAALDDASKDQLKTGLGDGTLNY